jgi:hypothetical protein
LLAVAVELTVKQEWLKVRVLVQVVIVLLLLVNLAVVVHRQNQN